MVTKRLGRREFLRWSALVGAGAAVAACATPTPQIIEKIVEKPVEKVVQETVVVKETVMVAGTPQVVEKEKIVEKVVTAVPAPKEIVKVFLWNADPIDLQAPYQAQIDGFNKKFAGSIVAESKNVAGGGWDEKLLTMLAANDGPDAWYTFGPVDQPRHGIFQNLTPYILGDNIKREEVWFDFAWQARLYQGQQYHVPRDVGTGGAIYNKSLFDEAGVPYPTSEWSVDDFVEMGLKIRNKDKGIWYSGIQSGQGGVLWASGGLPGNMGFDLISVDGRRVQGLLDSPRSIEVLQWYLDLQDKYDLIPNSEQAKGLGGDAFGSGKLALGDGGSWGVSALNEYKFKWDFVSYPKYKDNPRHAWVDAVPWVMWSGAKRKDEIWQLLKYISGPEGSMIAAKAGAWASPCPSVWKELGLDKDPSWLFFLDEFKKVPQKMYFNHGDYFWKCVTFADIWTRYIEQGERPLDAIVKDVAAKSQKCLDGEYAQEG